MQNALCFDSYGDKSYVHQLLLNKQDYIGMSRRNVIEYIYSSIIYIYIYNHY